MNFNLVSTSAKMQELDLKNVADLEMALRQLRVLAELGEYLDIHTELVRNIRDVVSKGEQGDLVRVRLMVFQLRKAVRNLTQPRE